MGDRYTHSELLRGDGSEGVQIHDGQLGGRKLGQVAALQTR